MDILEFAFHQAENIPASVKFLPLVHFQSVGDYCIRDTV